MAFVIARVITMPAVLVGSAWLVGRFRFLGLILSILAGWGILCFVYSTWPAPPMPNDWDEDREDMPRMAPFLMALWCVPIYVLITVCSWLDRRWDKAAADTRER